MNEFEHRKNILKAQNLVLKHLELSKLSLKECEQLNKELEFLLKNLRFWLKKNNINRYYYDLKGFIFWVVSNF